MDPENGCSTLFRNARNCLPMDVVSYPRTQWDVRSRQAGCSEDMPNATGLAALSFEGQDCFSQVQNVVAADGGSKSGVAQDVRYMLSEVISYCESVHI